MRDNLRDSYEPLTNREMEILERIAGGLSNQEIADQLFLALNTVKDYNKQIFQKMGVRNRTQAVMVAQERGLLAESAPAPQFHLPQQQSAFIARERELADIHRRLIDPKCRLLTLLGPGGIGKTRLALEAAEQLAGSPSKPFADGVGFVPLQPVNSPDGLIVGIAEAMHIPVFSDSDLTQQLLRALRNKSYLLILDNFDHLLEGAYSVSDILEAAPGTKVLVTSREALSLQEEWVYMVRGMSYPERADHAERYGAVQLFAYHAGRVRADFSLADEAAEVVRICTLVEGMPLALELAASWVRALSCGEIADEITRGLDILETPARNVQPRHSSMRAVLEHSWVLLTNAERKVFMRLAVFRGGFRREAAAEAAGASINVLSALVDKSWLHWDGTTKRYDIHELLRQYGEECLQADDAAWHDANERHCRYYAHFLEARRNDLRGMREKEAYAEIETELDNIRAYWAWAVDQHNGEAISEALDSLWLFYDMGSRFQEGQQTFNRAAQMLRSNIADPAAHLLLGRVLARQGSLSFSLDRFKEANGVLRESITILRQFDAPADLAFALFRLSMNNRDITNPEWKTLVEESLALFRQIGDLSGVGEALSGLGSVYLYQLNDIDRAVETMEESLAACLQVGDQRGIGTAYSSLARLKRVQGKHHEAMAYAQKCLDVFLQLGIVWGITIAYRHRGWAAYHLGLLTEARRDAYHAVAAAEKYGLVRLAAGAFELVAAILEASGEMERAVVVLALAEETCRRLGSYTEADEALARLQLGLPTALFAEAVQQGRSLDFEAATKALLDELSLP